MHPTHSISTCHGDLREINMIWNWSLIQSLSMSLHEMKLFVFLPRRVLKSSSHRKLIAPFAAEKFFVSCGLIENLVKLKTNSFSNYRLRLFRVNASHFSAHSRRDTFKWEPFYHRIKYFNDKWLSCKTQPTRTPPDERKINEIMRAT